MGFEEEMIPVEGVNEMNGAGGELPEGLAQLEDKTANGGTSPEAPVIDDNKETNDKPDEHEHKSFSSLKEADEHHAGVYARAQDEFRAKLEEPGPKDPEFMQA